ncbi:putative HTH-type transcriptional regulator LrrA [Hyella patelloides LEGE 07179]|uniref:Putative HTH-type transcriptional regulator LrrA n=1 Tax=Hyella patelloides LEGE 07179 TaxID=945734 RepID=A0A563VY20_9CYAN|nr:LysR family transcriptional regulator [Hyella patelloides]VEP16354.1 putative HTH-type transcriptional regulator LrrA [Hyella patelloides LEGE 07179]
MNAIDPHKLKISQLRILVAVADYRNFSEAALHLNISQSAISHAIATLETELGVILFYRGRNGANPTSVGEQLIAPAREILQLLQKMIVEANRAKGLEGGIVRLVSFRSAATHILPVLIAQFCRRFPLIKVNVIEVDEQNEIESILRSSKADIGLVHLPCSQEFESWEIYRDEYVVLLPRSLKLNQTQLTWKQLAKYPLILSAIESCSLRIRKYLQHSEESMNIAYEMKRDSTIISMAIEGLGAAILPRLAAKPVPEQLGVYSLPVPLERIIKAAVLKDALHTPAVFAFLDTLKDYSAIAKSRFPNINN